MRKQISRWTHKELEPDGSGPTEAAASVAYLYSTHQEVYVYSNQFIETDYIPPILNCYHMLKNDPNYKPQSALER